MPKKKSKMEAHLYARVPQSFVEILDAFLEWHPEYLDKSDFVRRAVFEKIQREDPDIYQLFVKRRREKSPLMKELKELKKES